MLKSAMQKLSKARFAGLLRLVPQPTRWKVTSPTLLQYILKKSPRVVLFHAMPPARRSSKRSPARPMSQSLVVVEAYGSHALQKVPFAERRSCKIGRSFASVGPVTTTWTWAPVHFANLHDGVTNLLVSMMS